MKDAISALGLPKNLEPFVKVITEHLSAVLKSTGMRDWLYTLAFFSAALIAYNTFVGAKKAIDLARIGRLGIGVWTGKVPLAAGGEENVDSTALLTSFVVAYMVLKIDASDVASAVGKLGPAVASAIGAIAP